VIVEDNSTVLNFNSLLVLLSASVMLLAMALSFCLGVVALAQISVSGGRRTGRGFAVIAVAVPFIVVPLTVLLPALAKQRVIYRRMTCGKNLSDIGKAMIIYASDYEDEFPRAGGRDTVWGGPGSVVWNALDRFQAYQLNADGSGGRATISSCFYLLVKYSGVTAKSFVCKGDRGTREFKAGKYLRDKELVDFWDFGPVPTKHCSYTYHMPFCLYALTTSSEPGMAVAADRNPWIASPAARAKNMAGFSPGGTWQQQKYGNSICHEEDGQQVLFMDGHVYFEKRAYCAINDDNIYTFWDGGDIRRGGAPVVGFTESTDRKDSFLVHDPLGPPRR